MYNNFREKKIYVYKLKLERAKRQARFVRRNIWKFFFAGIGLSMWVPIEIYDAFNRSEMLEITNGYYFYEVLFIFIFYTIVISISAVSLGSTR
ncbi:MAG TPA: hypothetical protein VFD80_00650 [Flavobacteriaceae bacterium]|nr:hypothetical protein [Flavobacteriaceae bacterium]